MQHFTCKYRLMINPLKTIIMRKIFASFGWMLLLLPLISVAGARTAFMIKHSVSDETRDVSGFTGISSGGSFKVHVTFGQKESLRIEGNEDILKEIETKVENGILKIGIKRNDNSFWGIHNGINIGRVDIYITAIKLNSLSSSGSGSIEVGGTVKSDNIQTAVSGSGNISLTIASDAYSASISGSGNITATGVTKTANIQVSGSGNFRGRDLKTDSSNIKVSGSGNVDIIADNSINAAVSGSGSIRYGGNATKISTTKSGSGRVSKM
jgi:hypothetical protein